LNDGAFGGSAYAAQKLRMFKRRIKDGVRAADAEYRLGNTAEVAGDAMEALEHYRRGADAGPTYSEDAEESLGFLYLHGKTVPKDLHKAHEYFQRAVEHGSVTALFNLGASYQSGTAPDGCDGIEKAKRLYRRAAALRHALARSIFAQLLCSPSHGGTVAPATMRKGMREHRRRGVGGPPGPVRSRMRSHQHGRLRSIPRL